jgi:hypothetical protein
VCDPWAACVIMADLTADGLAPPDDSALWTAIALCAANSPEPVIVKLPSSGCRTEVNPIPAGHPAYILSAHAMSRAQSFMPYNGEKVDEHGDYLFDPDEDARTHWTRYPAYYRRFLEKDAPRIRVIADLRNKLIRHLAATSIVHEEHELPARSFKVRRWAGGGALVSNQDGGLIGKIRLHPLLEAGRSRRQTEYLDFLVLADEFDRSAAVEALAREGIDLPFDPSPGWLNASVKPGLHGWLVVEWSGTVSGLNLRPHLAGFNIETQTLYVFASELADPVAQLLRRVGQRPTKVVVEAHTDDPAFFFGIDMFQVAREHAPDARPIRKLREEARALIPAEWADQLEMVWSPETPQIEINLELFRHEASQGTERDSPQSLVSPTSAGCRLCSCSSGGKPYCSECYKEAAEGLFNDRGFDEGWKGAVLWSLRTLADIEFGGPPALNQLAKPPLDGDNRDLLMLCRMLTSRRWWTEMGADRKAHAWTDWLAEAGLLSGGVRRSRGVTVTAKDGHICRSLLEREIDDFFYDNGIEHETEPSYPFDPELNVAGYRADWKLDDGTFVEALGFPGDSEYMAKAGRKLRLAALQGIPILTVTHEDLQRLPLIFTKWLPAKHEWGQSTGLTPRASDLPKDLKPKGQSD